MTERFPSWSRQRNTCRTAPCWTAKILVWRDDRPAPFALLQTRIARKTLSKKVLADARCALAYDVLEADGIDVSRSRAGGPA